MDLPSSGMKFDFIGPMWTSKKVSSHFYNAILFRKVARDNKYILN